MGVERGWDIKKRWMDAWLKRGLDRECVNTSRALACGHGHMQQFYGCFRSVKICICSIYL